ncbi:TIGR03086 family metal-binding protein [Streptomyces sp. NBRC 110028]|uniref:TIGR03086 family metal-binding protein n=1 Tax=Streptomyces sp. NBRC 110028 TaxID=1621260 RepID=UPI0006E3C2A3|nr:TIGR03086 family metal-binding protein [Streptomyces sp. NBRC 110028]
MNDSSEALVERYLLAGAEFEQRLRAVRAGQWAWPTPCTEWNVRDLVHHMTRGNLGYTGLLNGDTGEDFLRRRDADALGDDPVGAYVRSVRDCANAFARPGAFERVLDYPLGRVTGRQALAVRTTDSVIHTWDLARALGVDDRLRPDLVEWVDGHVEAIYAGLPETPTATETTHRFFAPPLPPLRHDAARQDRLLRRMGRDPDGLGPGGEDATGLGRA